MIECPICKKRYGNPDFKGKRPKPKLLDGKGSSMVLAPATKSDFKLDRNRKVVRHSKDVYEKDDNGASFRKFRKGDPVAATTPVNHKKRKKIKVKWKKYKCHRSHVFIIKAK